MFPSIHGTEGNGEDRRNREISLSGAPPFPKNPSGRGMKERKSKQDKEKTEKQNGSAVAGLSSFDESFEQH